MYDEFRIAILRIMYDIVNADGFIDDAEISALEELKKKYGIVSNGQENTDLIARSNKISFGEAVNILRKWRDKEELIEEGSSGKYSTKNFWEDINHLARIDGDCSTDEAHLLLAIQYMLSGDEDEVTKGVDKQNESDDLKLVLGELSEKEKEIMYMRYGLSGKNEMTQKEVASMLGISQSYISRIEKKVIKRLKALSKF